LRGKEIFKRGRGELHLRDHGKAEPAEEEDEAEGQGPPYALPPDQGSEEARKIVNPAAKEPGPDSAPHGAKGRITHPILL
jgi:hypothetical protein